jgi:hypothetical protein
MPMLRARRQTDYSLRGIPIGPHAQYIQYTQRGCVLRLRRLRYGFRLRTNIP